MHAVLCLVSLVQLIVTLWTINLQAPLLVGFSRKNTEVGCHALLQGIFLIQRWNPGLVSPALTGGFFTTSTTLEALYIYMYVCVCACVCIRFPASSIVKNPCNSAGDVLSVPGSGRLSGGRNGNHTPVFLSGKSKRVWTWFRDLTTTATDVFLNSYNGKEWNCLLFYIFMTTKHCAN